MPLADQEECIKAQALDFARDNKKRIAKQRTDPDVFLPEEHPVSIFMAGSPGAGKTEASLELIQEVGGSVLLIDPDELRSEFGTYTGNNSHLFQPAVSVLVERILDNDGSHRAYQANIDKIDNHAPEKYDLTVLRALLGTPPGTPS